MAENVFDIREASLIDFEAFVFDHDVHPVGSENVWYHQFETVILFDAKHNALRFTELLENSETLFRKYDLPRLEQGCWAMFGSGFQGNLSDLIWEQDIPIEIKVSLIEAMFFVYRDVFAKDTLGHACEMWWDGLAYDIHPMQIADPKNNLEHKRFQDAMFTTLRKILQLDNLDCQFAALHGLNHVAHPETETVIKQYVATHSELSEEEVEYAILCANGGAI
ncbi:MAG: hypothetical protein AAF720_15875 [Pseudomonadota bacterium]